MSIFRIFVSCGLLFLVREPTVAQNSSAQDANTLRTTVAVHQDGSRTMYEFDNANRKAIATTVGTNGKLREKIHYTLNDAGQFATGVVYGADERFRFKSIYKYDPSSRRLLEETQMDKGDVLLHRIVYHYDQAGKQLGYSVFDATGKLLNRIGGGSSPAARK